MSEKNLQMSSSSSPSLTAVCSHCSAELFLEMIPSVGCEHNVCIGCVSAFSDLEFPNNLVCLLCLRASILHCPEAVSLLDTALAKMRFTVQDEKAFRAVTPSSVRSRPQPAAALNLSPAASTSLAQPSPSSAESKRSTVVRVLRPSRRQLEVERKEAPHAPANDEPYNPLGWPILSPKELAEHPPLLREVFSGHERLLQQCCEPVCAEIIAADEKKDDARFDRAVKCFQNLPSRVLVVPDVRDGYMRAIEKQLQNGRAEIKHARESKDASDGKAPGRAEASFVDRTYRKCKRLIAKRQLSRAHACLGRKEGKNVREERVRAEVKLLFPSAPADKPLPPRPTPTKKRGIEPKEVKRLLYRLPKDIAPGPSGWTFELLSALKGSQLCVRALAVLLTRIDAGKISDDLAGYVLNTILIAAGKDNGGIRPIQMGEVIWKLAASYACRRKSTKSALAKILLPHQLGVGVSGGVQIAVHKVQALLDANPSHGALLVDFINAFNCVDRAAMLEAVRSHPDLAELVDIAFAGYDRPSEAFILADGAVLESIQCSQGARQGCPLGSLLFCLAVAPAYRKCVEAAASVTAVAIIDDLTLVGPVDQLKKAFEVLQSEMIKIGLLVNLPKTKLLLPRDHATLHYGAETSAWLASAVFKQEAERVELLGAVVGHNRAAMSRSVEDLVDKRKVFFDRLTDNRLTTQEAFALANASANHLITYLIGCVEPAVSKEGCLKYDRMALENMAKLLDIPLDAFTEPVLKQAQLPLFFGGISLPRTAALAPCAWLSVQSRASKHLKDVAAVENKSAPRRVQLENSLASVKSLCDREVAQLLPSESRDATQFFVAQSEKPSLSAQSLFRELSRSSARKSHRELLESAPSQLEKSRLRAVSAPKASLALSTLPSSRDLLVSNFAFSNLVRTRLGLKHADRLPEFCPYCKKEIQLSPQHAYNCQKRKKHEVEDRHDSVAAVLHRFAQTLGFVSRREPRPAPGVKRTRPDLVIKQGIGRKSLFVDVVIGNPYCDSHAAKGAAQELGTAIYHANRKVSKYAEFTVQNDGEFMPFAVELHGGMEERASKLIKLLRDQASKNGHFWIDEDVYTNIFRRIAVAVANGNADIVARSLRDSKFE